MMDAFKAADPVLTVYLFFLIATSAYAALLILRLPMQRRFLAPEIAAHRNTPPEIIGLSVYTFEVLKDKTENMQALVLELNESRKKLKEPLLPEGVLILKENDDYKKIFSRVRQGEGLSWMTPSGTMVTAMIEHQELKRALASVLQLGLGWGVVAIGDISKNINNFLAGGARDNNGNISAFFESVMNGDDTQFTVAAYHRHSDL